MATKEFLLWAKVKRVKQHGSDLGELDSEIEDYIRHGNILQYFFYLKKKMNDIDVKTHYKNK